MLCAQLMQILSFAIAFNFIIEFHIPSGIIRKYENKDSRTILQDYNISIRYCEGAQWKIVCLGVK
ncbi:MAG: hypothetical protein K0S76_2410 [Herbinix sp.]|jgi:hypothetical protein|nr:hypothetical protein [Herbinix sp.]